MTPLSLYVHIPFCARKCRYCDFYSLPPPDNDPHPVNRYIDALGREWRSFLDSGILDGMAVSTIYIGGGTPSLLDVDSWKRLDEVLFSTIDTPRLSEWSVECNPESFTAEKARAYAGSGVTRLTFGVQSLSDAELSICGRAHGAQRALDVLRDGCLIDMFKSVGADIIYALPGQTVQTLTGTLSSILSIQSIKHISAYELTIAANTPFGRHKRILPRPSQDSSAEMYELTGRLCAERGMRRYEVSNYALPGFESEHNKAYWSHKPYIGLGASAHSYIHPNRWSNAADVNRYISSMLSAQTPPDSGAADMVETIGPKELAAEMIFLGLRSAEGIDEDVFFAKTGTPLLAGGREKRLSEYAASGLLNVSGRKWAPTPKGMLFADMMAREL